jgi:hypothetical protein
MGEDAEDGTMKPSRYAVIYTWPAGTDIAGTVEIRYRRPRTDPRLAREVLTLQRAARRGGWKSLYSISTRPEHL